VSRRHFFTLAKARGSKLITSQEEKMKAREARLGWTTLSLCPFTIRG
jgi:hypothetical protein